MDRTPDIEGAFAVFDKDTEITPGIIERTEALLTSGRIEITAIYLDGVRVA